MDNQDYFVSKDGKAFFEKPTTAAVFYEDRFLAMQRAVQMLAAAREAQDLDGIKFQLTQLAILALPVTGDLSAYVRTPDEPEQKEGA